MKRMKLTSLAIIGINVGLLLCSFDAKGPESLTPEMRSFYEMLTPEAKKQFLELDSEHQKAVMNVINEHGCGAQAACKGIREDAVKAQYDAQMKQKQ